MKSGKRLSHDEKEFLRITAPDLYEKALKIEKERDEFRRALANCKTKEDALRLQTSKSMELQVEAKTKSGENDLEFMIMRIMAISDEFADFVKSEEYTDIPSEYEESSEESEIEENETIENGRKNGKPKTKKVKLTLNENMVLNGYKLNEAKILNRTKFSEPTKPVANSTTVYQKI